jgi:hypothetical protein
MIGAATTAYVDGVAQGLDIKDSCDVATTADDTGLTYANGTAGVGATLTNDVDEVYAIDGVNLTLNMRVLVKDQSPATENGIYYVSVAGAVGATLELTRALDANQPAELTGGSFTFVEQGTTQAENGYVFTHNGTPIFGVGQTALTVSQFSGAGQITAGTGLTKTGNTIDVEGTTNRISVAADAINIHTSYVGQTSLTTLGTIGTGTWEATDVAVAHGGTGASNAGGARTNLGLVIGTDVQAYDATIVVDADTFYIGTTQIAHNRSSAALELTGISIADGANDFDIKSHDGTNGLRLGGDLVTATAAQLNNTAQAATTGKSIAMAIVFG